MEIECVLVSSDLGFTCQIHDVMARPAVVKCCPGFGHQGTKGVIAPSDKDERKETGLLVL